MTEQSMASLFLIRHGSAELPDEERYCIGAADLPLSDEGRRQMEDLRGFVRSAGIRRIYVSDLARSRESGEILAGGEIPVTVREELRENAMGAWEMLPFRKIRERFPEEYRRRGEDLAHHAPEGGESFEECRRRAVQAFRRILSEMDGNVAIVGHLGFFRTLICALEGRPLDRLMDVSLACGEIYEWQAGPPLGAVVVAAGLSSRMGELKPLLPVPGGSMLTRELSLLARAGVRRTVVVTGHEAARIRSGCDMPGVSFVHNPDYAATKMLDSVRLGLAALPEELEGAFVLPADAPAFSLFTLQREKEAYLSGDADCIRPVRAERHGHPLLLRRRFFSDVAGYDGEQGLRGLLARQAGRVLDLPLPEPGLALDADTPVEYRELLEYLERDVPDRARCEEILAWSEVPEAVRLHCEAAARQVERLAGRLRVAGVEIDTDVVRAAALLHDVAKGRPNHAALGARWLRELGMPSVADAMERHTDLPERKTVTPEELTVFLADKMVLGSSPCTLAERYESRLREYGADEEAAAEILRRWEQARKWQDYYERLADTAGNDSRK